VPHDESLKLWNEVMGDMYGNEDERKKKIIDMCQTEPNVSEQAKKWLLSL